MVLECIWRPEGSRDEVCFAVVVEMVFLLVRVRIVGLLRGIPTGTVCPSISLE